MCRIKKIYLISLCFVVISFFNNELHAKALPNSPSCKVTIVGGGIIGAIEAYYAYIDAQKKGERIHISIYDKGTSFGNSTFIDSSKIAPSNTAFHIVPSLTIDEILSVVPRGQEMVEYLAILFDKPKGIRVDDVPNVNDSEAAVHFKESVANYGADKNHNDRTQTLLRLGKMSMDLWQELYDNADLELKRILIESNFHPCKETYSHQKKLYQGYRIDLIYGIADAEKYARCMQSNYQKLGYNNCKILSPDEVIDIDPFLTDFCKANSNFDENKKRKWTSGAVALWRPGGCIDTAVFLPKFYDYLKKIMGKYTNKSGAVKDCFKVKFNREVTGVEYGDINNHLEISCLKFKDGSANCNKNGYKSINYVFCPGESVGTLYKLGFAEPAYAGFAGTSLMLSIPISDNHLKKYKKFSHYMEVHKEGIVLAWQARIKEGKIFIGVGGTKAFYGDKQPSKNEDFAKNRHLLQLNMINEVLPEFVSLAFGYDTKAQILNEAHLKMLEDKEISGLWVGRRAVAYDGFPTLGALYHNNRKIKNARCTTHLGSGGVSFAPAAIKVSRCYEQCIDDPFINKVLMYSASNRTAEQNEL